MLDSLIVFEGKIDLHKTFNVEKVVLDRSHIAALLPKFAHIGRE